MASVANLAGNVCLPTSRQGNSHASLRASTPKAAMGKASLAPKTELRSLSSAFSGCSLSANARAGATYSRGALIITSSNTLEAGVGMFGHKAGMTQIFSEDGDSIPVTVLSMKEGNLVSSIFTEETNGYTAVQVAYNACKDKHINKPEMGHLEKAGLPPMKLLQEFRVKSAEGYEVGQQLKLADMFKEGDLVDVQGKSIGKGFQGCIKRWNHSRGPMTHGSKSHREHGSMGAGTTPGRVLPGTKLPGRMGNKKVKVRKLKVVRVDEENNCLMVKGSVPGKPGNILRITPAKIVGVNV